MKRVIEATEAVDEVSPRPEVEATPEPPKQEDSGAFIVAIDSAPNYLHRGEWHTLPAKGTEIAALTPDMQCTFEQLVQQGVLSRP